MKKQIIYIAALLFIGMSATAQIDRSKMPESGPTPEVNLGKPEEFKLDNGLQVLVVRDTKLPAINISLNLDTPPVFEGDKAGVQSLTSSIMGKGTTKTPKDEFNENVEFLGASVNVFSGGGFANALSKYKERVFELFAEAALMPNFTQEELDFEKEQLLEGIRSGENSAEAIAGKVRGALAYGKKHAAGEFPTETTIGNVSLEDVKDFYAKRFVPSNGYMVITGDITGKEAKQLVKKNFGAWKAGEVTIPEFPMVKDVDNIQVNLVDVPNAVQTELAVMTLSDLKMNDDDYHAATVANYILGGAFGSYLNMNLREANGYTYGARSSLGTSRYYPSTFRATAKVRNEVTDSAVVETLKEIKRIRTEPVDKEVLENAKAKFLGNFIMQSEDKSVVARRTVRIRTNNLDDDFYKDFISNINDVTQEDVQRVAQKYFRPENARVVLVGKASDILEPLEKMTFEGKPVVIKFFDKDANPTERPSTITVPDGVTVQTVLNDYVKAIGGKEALSEVMSVATKATLETPMGNVELSEKRMKGDKWRLSISMGGNVMSDQMYADGKGMVKAQGQTMEMEGDNLAAQATEAIFLPELNAQEKATLAGVEMMEEKKVYVIKWSDSKKSFYDTESGLLVASETKTNQGGQDVTQLVNYSNYQETNGIKFPMTLSQNMMGREVNFEVKAVKINEGVTPDDFK